MTDPTPRLLVTDLDNTVWDWFEAWYQSFSALLDGLVEMSGVDRTVLEDQIRVVHRHRGTTEYSNLLREVPSLVAAAGTRDPAEVFNEALHAQNSRRKATTRLYAGVEEALRSLKDAGVRIAAYTESGAYWTEWRIRQTGLDGIIDVLYSSPDHDAIAGVDVANLRTGHYGPDEYGLRVTKHLHVPHGVLKPNQEILQVILDEQGCAPHEAVYLGDSLMKDIAMAQAAGVLDVHAAYGLVQHREEYELLRRVTHWSEEDVEREKALADATGEVVPTRVCRERLDEVLPLFGLSLERSR
jgi:phosphoglycolate phosphatase